jgi:P-type conjugative transfer protein TrbJ
MLRRDLAAAVLTAFCLLVAGGARAGGVIAGATEPTQIMNNLELVKVALDSAKTASTAVNQYSTQLQQYQTQLANLRSLPQLPDGMGSDAVKALNDLGRFKGALQQLTGSLGQQQSVIEQRLAEARLSGKDWNGYLSSVAADAANKNRRAVARLQYEESVLQQVQSDYSFARNLQGQIPATAGQHQALQLMNAQMNRLITQNAKLLEVMSTTLAQQSEKDASEAEWMTRSLTQRELLRQRQEAIERRQRRFGGLE